VDKIAYRTTPGLGSSVEATTTTTPNNVVYISGLFHSFTVLQVVLSTYYTTRYADNMGGCCSCFDGITGGKHGNDSGNSDGKSTEMATRNSIAGVPPPTHGVSRAMSAPTIQIQGYKVRVT
jgi:hypothetical protein